MRSFITLAAVIAIAVAISAQNPDTSPKTETSQPKHETKDGTLGWKCHKHGTVCQLDVEDIFAALQDPSEMKGHEKCDPATAIWLDIDRGQSLLIAKRNMKTADFGLSLVPDVTSKELVQGSPYPFTNPTPHGHVKKWWSGPAMAAAGSCYHLEVNRGAKGKKAKKEIADPHIMFCGGGTLCG